MSEVVEVRYRYRLRVASGQAAQLQDVFDSCRFVWNQALGRWQDLWRHEQVGFSYRDAAAELTDWRGRFDWLAAQPQCPQQQTLRFLFRSIAAFFDNANPAGRPKFKGKGTHATAEWTRNGFVVTGAGRWWASFVVRVTTAERTETGRTTGVDVGLTTFATTTDPDYDIANPRIGRRSAVEVAAASRRLARCSKGSRRRAKAKRRLARIHATVADRRRDHHHKAARKLALAFDEIGVEDLRVKNLLANRHLARAIADAGWGEFLQILEHQARKAGSTVIRMDPRNTSQTCFQCGTKAKSRLQLDDRTLRCDYCGLFIDRDRNAAHNLDPGRTEPGEGDDGTKTFGPAGPEAA